MTDAWLQEKLECLQGLSTLGEIAKWLKPEFDLEVKYQAVRQNSASVLSRSLFQKSNMISIGK
ncbi:MAG: hypothetical protein V7K46_13915 [Nostoc sp.]